MRWRSIAEHVGRGRRRAAAVMLGAALVVAATTSGPAGASWASSASGAATARSATPAPPTGVVASCDLVLPNAVTLTWSASATGWVSGYEVRWGTTSGGPYPSTSGVVGGLTFTTPGLGAGTYYFVVQSAKDAWRSAPTAQVSRTIVTVVLDLVCV